MKIEIFIDKNAQEKVQIFAKEHSTLVDKIKSLVEEQGQQLIGYTDREAVPLRAEEISLFISEGGKIYALVGDKRYRIKERLYLLEQRFFADFVKINQSCLARTGEIKRFEAAFSGSLRVIFKNGYSDYVSRRCLKAVKERLGIK